MQALPRVNSVVIIPVLLLLACDSLKGDLGVYTGTEATAGETSGTTGGTTTAGESDTGATGGATTTSGGVSECIADEEYWETFELTFDPPLLEGAFDGECLVSDGEGFNGLICGEQQISLVVVINHQPAPLLEAGETVKFSYRAQMSFGRQEWFVIRRASDAVLRLGGVDAETLVPPGETEFFAPLALEGVEGVCAPPVDCDAPFEPLKVAVTLDGETIQVPPGTYDQIGAEPYDISVLQARRLHNGLPDGQGGFCSVSDVPEYFYRIMLRTAP